jgi:hypothetical protein
MWEHDFSCVRAIANGGYVLVGRLAASFDATLVQLDASGSVVWARQLDNFFR